MPLRCLLLLLLTVVSGCESQPNVAVRRGLTSDGTNSLDALLAAQSNPDEFNRELESLASNGDFESVLVLTHAMFELPWVDELKPQSRYDTRMPKLAVERRLDQVVAASKHDGLSARYFRALDGRGDISQAKDNLLSWTIEHRHKLVWDEDRFVLLE